MNQETRASIGARMKRIAGQIAGIQRMIEDDRYCVDVLNQISAARAALDAVGVELVTGHIESCVLAKNGHESGSKHATPMSTDELLAELRTALSRFLK
ncbi:MAG TPA: metal-sensitive transcriptional regulator [Chthoniobacterales bacterium]